MRNIIDMFNEKMPNYINTDTDEYKAIYGDTEFTPEVTITQSSDYNCGAIANELEFLRKIIDIIIESDDVDSAEGDILDALIFFLLGLLRLDEEIDTSFRLRANSLLIRNGNESWCTKQCMKDVFSYFISESNLFVMENYVSTDLLINGDFETVLGSEWTLINPSGTTVQRITTDPFDDEGSLQINIDTTLGVCGSEQSVVINNVTHTFEFFMKSITGSKKINVSLTRSSDSYTFDFDTLTWNSGSYYKEFEVSTSDTWYYIQDHFLMDSSDTVTIRIYSPDDAEVGYDVIIDAVKLGEKKTYPTFKIIAIVNGQSGSYASLWQAGSDPLTGSYDYDDVASYLDQAYLGGVGSSVSVLFDEILSIIKPSGVYAEFEYVTRYVV